MSATKKTQAHNGTLHDLDKCLVVGARQVSHFYLRDSVYSANVKISRHHHEQPIFCMALKGGCQENYASGQRLFTPLTVSFLPAGHQHSLQTLSQGMRSFTIHIAQEWLASFADKSSEFNTSVYHSGGELIDLTLKLFREFQIPDGSSALATEGLILEMLAEVARNTCCFEKKTPKWLGSTTEAIHEQIETPPSLTQLATSAGVHPVHLARSFRRTYGCTVSEYRRRVRTQKACEMLSLTKMPLAQIATTLGFFDQSHFTRVFKRVRGVTPLEYRTRFSTG